MSCQTSTWPSQSGPAPMPIVGMSSSSVTRAATVGGHHLEDDGEGAGLLEGEGVVEQAVAGVAAALHAVAAERVLGLRREADVCHDGDAGADERSTCGATRRRPRA